MKSLKDKIQRKTANIAWNQSRCHACNYFLYHLRSNLSDDVQSQVWYQVRGGVWLSIHYKISSQDEITKK